MNQITHGQTRPPISRASVMAACALALTLALVACGGGGSQDSNDSALPEPLAMAADEPVGLSCSRGGSQIGAGFDANGNGALDSSEIGNVQSVCQPD